jgi:rubredoxin
MHCYTEEPCSDYDEEWDEEIPETRYCPNCGAKMDAKEG